MIEENPQPNPPNYGPAKKCLYRPICEVTASVGGVSWLWGQIWRTLTAAFPAGGGAVPRTNAAVVLLARRGAPVVERRPGRCEPGQLHRRCHAGTSASGPYRNGWVGWVGGTPSPPTKLPPLPDRGLPFQH